MNNFKQTYLKHALVKKTLRNNGIMLTWLYKQLELSRADGSLLLNYGVLPKQKVQRERILQQLSEITALPVKKLIVTVQCDDLTDAA